MVCDGDAWLRFGTLCYDMPLLASPNGSIGCIRFARRVLCTHTPDHAAAIVQEIDTSPKKRLQYRHLDFTISRATHLCMRNAKRSLPNYGFRAALANRYGKTERGVTQDTGAQCRRPRARTARAVRAANLPSAGRLWRRGSRPSAGRTNAGNMGISHERRDTACSGSIPQNKPYTAHELRKRLSGDLCGRMEKRTVFPSS